MICHISFAEHFNFYRMFHWMTDYMFIEIPLSPSMGHQPFGRCFFAGGTGSYPPLHHG